MKTRSPTPSVKTQARVHFESRDQYVEARDLWRGVGTDPSTPPTSSYSTPPRPTPFLDGFVTIAFVLALGYVIGICIGVARLP